MDSGSEQRSSMPGDGDGDGDSGLRHSAAVSHDAAFQSEP